jgi:hypothetical protein
MEAYPAPSFQPAELPNSSNSHLIVAFQIRVSLQQGFTLAISMVFGMLLGLQFWKIRVNPIYSEKIVTFPFVNCLIFFVVICVTFVTNITILFQMTETSNFEINIILLILCFVYNGIFSLIFIVITLFFKDVLELHMEGLILYEQARVFSVLYILSIVFGPLVLIFLPWRKSEFSIRSEGFPTLRIYRLIMYSEMGISLIRLIAVTTSTERTSMSNISILISSLQFVLSSIHIFVKLQALSIQQYDVEIYEKNKFQSKTECVNDSTIIEINNDVQMAEVIVIDIEKCEEDLEVCRLSLQELRQSNISNRRTSARYEDPIISPIITSHAATTAYADENIKVLQNQLSALNLKPLEYIPLHQIRHRLQTLTDAINRGEIIDENEFDHLLRCMDVNEEYIQEQKEKERLWREKISTYAQECLIEQLRFIPSDIFISTQTQLVHEKGIPAILAKRLLQKKCLWLTRMSESYISKLHYAELQGKYSVEGNNLDIVETLAIYASVPIKFPNDGNGKKALWRKSLNDTVKKLMTSKDNNTLSASQLRNPAYKNYIGPFITDELYNPDMCNSNSTVLAELQCCSKKEVDPQAVVDEPVVPSVLDNIVPMAPKDKINIKTQLQSIFSRKINTTTSSIDSRSIDK